VLHENRDREKERELLKENVNRDDGGWASLARLVPGRAQWTAGAWAIYTGQQRAPALQLRTRLTPPNDC